MGRPHLARRHCRGISATDLAVALGCRVPGDVALLFQDPSAPGDFGGAVHVPVGVGGTTITSADVDGDGHVDVVTGEGPQVLYGDAARPGTLQSARPL